MSPIKAALPKGMGEKKLESKWRKKCYFDRPRRLEQELSSRHISTLKLSKELSCFLRTNNNRDLLP